MYKLIFLDLDGTIFDFDKTEKHAICQNLISFGLPHSAQILDDYHTINAQSWASFERGEISKEQLVIDRHLRLFKKHNINFDAVIFNENYERLLKNSADLLDNALEILQYLSAKYILCVASNGTKETQVNRLKLANITQYFTYFFISQDIGFVKPSAQFFAKAQSMLPQNIAKAQMVIVGDSLTSDILGGINFGIDTIWLNNHNLPCALPVTHQITKLSQLKLIL
ncbi:MAG: YjjG family noncanonical pyrimidine nucleotidase [Clostridia bacterium]